MKCIKERLTFTNIIFVVTVIVYILNIFVISPDTGSMSLKIIDSFKTEEVIMPNTVIFKILGIWGGHLNDLFGFNMNKILLGEIWRIYTVVFTHSHLPHFLMNMFALIIAGNNIEKKYGTLKTIELFIILVAINNFITNFIYFDILNNEIITSYGASGWITILMGMILSECILNKNYFKDEFKKLARVYLILYFILTTFIIMPNLFTITAHTGGLIIGIISGLIIARGKNKRVNKNY